MMKLVQWYDGTYGVVKGFFMRHAVGHDGFWWYGKEYWAKYCKFQTQAAALQAANKTNYKVIDRV